MVQGLLKVKLIEKWLQDYPESAPGKGGTPGQSGTDGYVVLIAKVAVTGGGGLEADTGMPQPLLQRSFRHAEGAGHSGPLPRRPQTIPSGVGLLHSGGVGEIH